MEEISEVQAKTIRGPQFLLNLTHFTVLKMMHNGDYLVRDQLADNYLLCHSATKHLVDLSPSEISASHLLYPHQTINEQGNFFEVFPMDARLTWAGDVCLTTKSQLYCLSLLYSAVRHIAKPLVGSNLSHAENYIVEDNLWFKNTSCYLFLCSRTKTRHVYKTEHFSRKGGVKAAKGASSRQRLLFGKLGEVFWRLWSRQEAADKRSSVFGEILKGMIKGELSLEYFQKIMQSKMAKKKFIAQLDKHKSIVRPVQLKFKVNISQPAETIDYSTLYSRLDNLPLTIDKPQRPYIHQQRSLNPRSLAFDSPLKLANLIDSQEENYPPSFAKIRKHKRLSLFSQNRQSSSRRERYGSFSKDLNSMNLGARTISTGQRYSDTIDSQLYYKNISSKAAMKRLKKRQINEFFLSGKYDKRTSYSKKDTIEQKSKEKALNLFKKSLEVESIGQESLIDDSKFKAQLKAKRISLKQTFGKVLLKASEAISVQRCPDLSSAVSLRQGSQMISYQKGSGQRQVLQGQHVIGAQMKVFNQNIARQQGLKAYPIKEQLQEEYFILSPTRRTPEIKETDSHSFSKETFVNIPIQEQRAASFKIDSRTQKHQDHRIKKQTNTDDEIKLENHADNFPQHPKPTNTSSVILQKNIELIKKQSLGSEIGKNNTEDHHQKQKQSEKHISPHDPIHFQNNDAPLKTQHNIGSHKDDFAKELEASAPSSPLKPDPIKEYYFEKGNSQVIELKQAEDYRFVSALKSKREAPEKQEDKKITNKSKVPKSEKVLKNSFKQHQQIDDEVEQVLLLPNEMVSKLQAQKKPASVSPLPPAQPKKEEPALKQELNVQLPKNKPTGEAQPPIAQRRSEKQLERTLETREKKDREISQEKKNGQRMKTGQSNASSTGGKTVRKQIDEYVYMVNKMGEAVAKSSKLIKKLEGVQWYVGVYFLYKRFFHQRAQIEKYLLEEKPYLTRYEPFARQEWLEWLAKGEKQALLKKYQDDNRNISASLAKMAKKVEALPLPASVMMNVGIHKNIQDSSLVAVDYVIAEYDQLVEMNLIRDSDVFVHICEMINALLVMAELDGKIKQKRPVVEYANTKRTQEELKDLVKKIEDLYEED